MIRQLTSFFMNWRICLRMRIVSWNQGTNEIMGNNQLPPWSVLSLQINIAKDSDIALFVLHLTSFPYYLTYSWILHNLGQKTEPYHVWKKTSNWVYSRLFQFIIIATPSICYPVFNIFQTVWWLTYQRTSVKHNLWTSESIFIDSHHAAD